MRKLFHFVLAVVATSWVCTALVADETRGPATEISGKVAPQGASTNDLLFKIDSQRSYKLVRTPMSEALFLDTNLHSKILVLKGRPSPDKKSFEVTGNLHSLRAGRTNELFYYCDVCSIKSSLPGPCACCREPVKLREEPLERAATSTTPSK